MIMARKGTVFKVKPHSLILMTGDFEFREVKKRAPARPGQEITFQDSDIIRPGNKRLLALVASVLMIVLFSASLLKEALVPGVYAYVGMDINPSLELALDKDLRVIDAEPENEDAGKVLQDLPLKGLPLKEAVTAVINECREKGYLNSSTSHIMISTTVNSPQRETSSNIKLEEQVLSCTREQLENNQEPVNVYVVQVNKEEREQARDKGMSAAKYFLWNKSKEKGLEIDPEQINSQSISNIVRQNNEVETVLTQSAAMKWKAVKDNSVPKGPQKTKKNPRGREMKDSNSKASPAKANTPKDPGGTLPEQGGKKVPGANAGGKGNPKAEQPAPGATLPPEKGNKRVKDSTDSGKNPAAETGKQEKVNGKGKDNNPSKNEKEQRNQPAGATKEKNGRAPDSKPNTGGGPKM